jgi:endonuclease/exonuclease/phosphatase family metal-dependent hydrolase
VDRHSVDDVSFEMNGRIERILRGILDVTLQITPSFQLRLVGAHLKSQRTVSSYDEASLRAREAWQLRKHIDDILTPSPDTNLLLFGDLNDTKNNYPIREIIGTPGQAAALRDLWLKDNHGETWTHFWKAADIYSRIDYLLVNSALAPHVVPQKSGISSAPFWNDASDHRAIYTTISP